MILSEFGSSSIYDRSKHAKLVQANVGRIGVDTQSVQGFSKVSSS